MKEHEEDDEFDVEAFDTSAPDEEWYTPRKRDTWAVASNEAPLSLDEVATALVVAGKTRLVVDLAAPHPGKDSNLVLLRPDLLPADIRRKVSGILAHLDTWEDRVGVLRSLGIAWKWVPRRGRPPKRSNECLGLAHCGKLSGYTHGGCGGEACSSAMLERERSRQYQRKAGGNA